MLKTFNALSHSPRLSYHRGQGKTVQAPRARGCLLSAAEFVKRLRNGGDPASSSIAENVSVLTRSIAGSPLYPLCPGQITRLQFPFEIERITAFAGDL
ncbi:hypothetical protein BaRGS_00039857 [Batillaria attramentaria]|uniref:Uncharacterized protein n=1 Tax=Batillaria attramentaria TaxID=370345 RepID=A0ABD0J247_9CAEN